MITGLFIFLCAWWTAPPPVLAQSADTDVFALNRNLGRAVNIIGYDPLWRSFDQARFKTRHFQIIKEGGFSSVRINLHPFRYMGAGPDYPINSAWLQTLDWAVTNALARDLNVILDFHEFNRLGQDAEGNRERFLSFWRQVAPRFKDASAKVFFEILNEPNGKLTPELWNQYLAQALAIIRTSNPTRAVIIGPAFWNSVDHLDELKLPEDDRRLIVTVHYYKPMAFTHQGASWTNQKDKLGIEWTGAPEEKAAMNGDFEKVQAWSAKNNRPMLLGEFGAYDKAGMASRVNYTASVARAAERLGWSWAYWQFDADFIVYDIPKDKWVDPIHEALIPEARTDRSSNGSK